MLYVLIIPYFPSPLRSLFPPTHYYYYCYTVWVCFSRVVETVKCPATSYYFSLPVTDNDRGRGCLGVAGSGALYRYSDIYIMWYYLDR